MKRKTPLVAGMTFHIYTRGVEKRVIFPERTFNIRFLNTLQHNLNYKYPYSLYKQRLEEAKTPQAKENVIASLELHKVSPSVEIYCFCLMPNHYHFIMKQLVEEGITNFMHRLNTAYTKYVNRRLDRVGGLFQGRFKSKHIETTEQLIHLSRYQHINPTKLGLGNTKTLIDYPWSSLSDFIGNASHNFVTPNPVMQNFESKNEYRNFLEAEIDEYEPLRLAEIAIDDDFGWFRKFRALEKEKKEILRDQYMKTL